MNFYFNINILGYIVYFNGNVGGGVRMYFQLFFIGVKYYFIFFIICIVLGWCLIYISVNIYILFVYNKDYYYIVNNWFRMELNC